MQEPLVRTEQIFPDGKDHGKNAKRLRKLLANPAAPLARNAAQRVDEYQQVKP